MTSQAPILSGFGAQTSAAEAMGGADLRGKLAIVTGGYSGLGLETTRALAEAGAIVIVPARSAEKACEALAGISRVEQSALDLLDPASIAALRNHSSQAAARCTYSSIAQGSWPRL